MMTSCQFTLSNRLSDVKASSIRTMIDKVAALKASGKDVLSLVAGEPDFPTPQPIKDATVAALNQDFTHYGSNRGYPKLRDKISKLLLSESNLSYDPETEIVVTCGGAEALNNIMFTMIDPGDEVIIFSPAFLSYENLVHLCGGTVVTIPLKKENGFQIDLDETKQKITSKTKMIIVNNPNNPTGVVYHKETLEGLAKLAVEHNLYILTDEIYSRLVYDDNQFYSLASFPHMKERTIVISGFSKTYAMTGWRLGFAAASEPIISSLMKVHQYSSTCCPTFLQIGLSDAIDTPETKTAVDLMIAEFDCRRKLMMELLDQIPSISYSIPQGAFYVFIDVSKTGMSGEEFSARLIDEQYVGTVPGIGLGTHCSDFVRLSYAVSQDTITAALQRIKGMLSVR